MLNASVQLEVYSLSGTKVANVAEGNSLEFPAPGLYIIRTLSATSKVMVK